MYINSSFSIIKKIKQLSNIQNKLNNNFIFFKENDLNEIETILNKINVILPLIIKKKYLYCNDDKKIINLIPNFKIYVEQKNDNIVISKIIITIKTEGIVEVSELFDTTYNFIPTTTITQNFLFKLPSKCQINNNSNNELLIEYYEYINSLQDFLLHKINEFVFSFNSCNQDRLISSTNIDITNLYNTFKTFYSYKQALEFLLEQHFLNSNTKKLIYEEISSIIDTSKLFNEMDFNLEAMVMIDSTIGRCFDKNILISINSKIGKKYLTHSQSFYLDEYLTYGAFEINVNKGLLRWENMFINNQNLLKNKILIKKFFNTKLPTLILSTLKT